jgi:hypothetical protein
VIALFALGASSVCAQTATPAPAAEAKKPAAPAPKETAARPLKKIEAKATPAPPMSTPRKAELIAVAPRAPKPEATLGEPKVSFWKKLFGGRKATPAPATPAATPAGTPRGRRPRATPAPEEAGALAKKADSAKPPKTKPSDQTPPGEKPEPGATANVPPKNESESPEPVTPPAATPAPVKKPGKTRPVADAKNIPPTTSAEAEVQEKYKYDMAKAKALTDPEVLKLKEKAESAVSEDEARKAQRAYTKALFNKMRSIDGSIKERADRIEAGIIRRLESAE